MKRTKKFLAIVLTAVLFVLSSQHVNASECKYYNVVEKNPYTNNIADGLGRPSKDTCVNLVVKELTFAGVADHSVLYSNSCFTGKDNPAYDITNYSGSELKVKVHSMSTFLTVCTIKVPANETLSGTLSGVKADKKYYLTFDAPSDFSGKVF